MTGLEPVLVSDWLGSQPTPETIPLKASTIPPHDRLH